MQQTTQIMTDYDTLFLYRRMKFIKKPAKQPSKYPVLTSITNLENFIESTKLKIDNLLTKQNHQKRNISTKELKALEELRNPVITIKPADKNLGTVILNSADYVEQCLLHLVTDTYQRVAEFPTDNISRDIQNTLISFKEHLTLHPQLYQFLQPKNEHTIPKFYRLPKIHKPLEKKCNSTYKTNSIPLKFTAIKNSQFNRPLTTATGPIL